MSGSNKRYVGDSVYASFDGHQLWIETNNGLGPTNKIALEPTVFNELLSYVISCPGYMPVLEVFVERLRRLKEQQLAETTETVDGR